MDKVRGTWKLGVEVRKSGECQSRMCGVREDQLSRLEWSGAEVETWDKPKLGVSELGSPEFK